MTDKKWYGKDNEEDIVIQGLVAPLNDVSEYFLEKKKAPAPPKTPQEYANNYVKNNFIYGDGISGLDMGDTPPVSAFVNKSSYIEIIRDLQRKNLEEIKDDFFEEYPGLETLRDTMPFEAIMKISGTEEFYYAQAIILEMEINEQEKKEQEATKE